MTLQYRDFTISGTAEELKSFIDMIEKNDVQSYITTNTQSTFKFYDCCPACGSKKIARTKTINGLHTTVFCAECGHVLEEGNK